MFMLPLISYLLLIPLALSLTWLLLKAKPLPGIPHNDSPYFNHLGDLPSLISWVSKRGTPQLWMNPQAEKLGPICQLIIGSRRIIIVSDAQEVEDILSQRKGFERGRGIRKTCVYLANYAGHKFLPALLSP
jgi:hypothetical protein